MDPMSWVNIDSIVFPFLARKNTTMNNIIMINDVHASRARSNIDVGYGQAHLWVVQLGRSHLDFPRFIKL